MNTMSYKGYTARIAFDERDGILTGRLLGTSDVVSFHAESEAELHTAFVEAVDDYLNVRAQLERPVQNRS